MLELKAILVAEKIGYICMKLCLLENKPVWVEYDRYKLLAIDGTNVSIAGIARYQGAICVINRNDYYEVDYSIFPICYTTYNMKTIHLDFLESDLTPS